VILLPREKRKPAGKRKKAARKTKKTVGATNFRKSLFISQPLITSMPVRRVIIIGTEEIMGFFFMISG